MLAHITNLFCIFLLTIGLFVPVKLIFINHRLPNVTIAEDFSFFCMIFLLSWWMRYFFMNPLSGVGTLRTYLRVYSNFRAPNNKLIDLDEKTETAIVDKSRSTTTTIALMITIISITIGVILRRSSEDIYSDFQLALKPLIVNLSFVTIIFFVFAIDLLDTVINSFKEFSKEYNGFQVLKNQEPSPFRRKLIFYDEIGNWPKGGISYAYVGYALFTLIILMSVSFFYHCFTGYILGAFIYLGYPICFGYIIDEAKEGKVTKISVDRTSVFLISVLLALLFIFLQAAATMNYCDSL